MLLIKIKCGIFAEKNRFFEQTSIRGKSLVIIYARKSITFR
jgi:hypothetical protein